MLTRFKSFRPFRPILLPLLFSGAFFFGHLTGFIVEQVFPAAAETSSEGNWGLSFQEEGEAPIGNAKAEDLKELNAYYTGDTGKQIIYLTFDAGYENGNTGALLDALKKHHAPATFFVVGNFIEDNPDLIKG